MADRPEDVTRLQDALAGIWSIERELGRGGMATVYLARDVALDRPVALKVLHAALAAQPEQRERFIREARTGAKLSHPNIVPIYAVEEQDGSVYFVMGLVDGETLGERIRRDGPIPADDATRILREVSWALGYVHAMGLVHRDVTLENILIERSSGRAILADFGIAAEVDRAEAGPLIGTPAYLAPEIIQGEASSPESDIYALGVVAWSMLAGRHPFLGDDTASVLLKHLSEPVPSLARAAPATPSRMVRVVERAMEKVPHNRPATIESWLSDQDAEVPTAALSFPLRRWLSRWDAVKPFYAVSLMSAWLYGPIMVFLLGWLPQFIWNTQIPLVAFAARALPAILCAAAIHLTMEFKLLRGLAREGYGRVDLQLALATDRQTMRRTGQQRAGVLARAVHSISWIAGIAYMILAWLVFPYLRMLMSQGQDVNHIMRLLGSISELSKMIFWNGLSFSILLPHFHLKPDGRFVRLREAFWSSRFADGLMRLATIGLPRLRGAAETLHRPTELVLDLAIDDLWQALPDVTRRGLSDLPKLAEGIRHRVADVKELEQLIEHSQLGHADETAALRTRLAAQHQAGVTALERLRLLLGKLGGAAAPDSEFTAQLASARGIEQELLAELGAHTDLRKLLKKGRRNGGMTPQATPA